MIEVKQSKLAQASSNRPVFIFTKKETQVNFALTLEQLDEMETLIRRVRNEYLSGVMAT